MSALPQISEAEYEVMKIVWKYLLLTQMRLLKNF